MDDQVRVLIVDDSAFMRQALTKILSEGRGIEVVGTASNGIEALAGIKSLHPDVVTLDIEMPQMDGMATLEAIMGRNPMPVVMLSSLTQRGAEMTIRCLELGAVDFIPKPTEESLESKRYLIWKKVRDAAGAHVVTTGNAPAVVMHHHRRSVTRARRVVAIGASTGGPRTLLEVLQALPESLPAGIVIVQHMPPGFTAVMAQRFDNHCALSVREAVEGDQVMTGQALVAPGGRHLGLTADGAVRLTDDPPIWGVRPSADVMLTDVAAVYGAEAIGVLLTGMGRDGAQGLLRLKQAGGVTMVQDEESCTVFGMPRAALEIGAAEIALPPVAIAKAITDWCKASPLVKYA